MQHHAPTLGQLNTNPHWLWLYCRNYGQCHHSAPAAIAPYVIRWGADASSDLLRTRARCTKCGSIGADLRHASWQDMAIGYVPFPLA